ncbi:metallophosphoesterase [Dactylosporangium matsuzakiense]|uniref:Metallophosphatase n=1 Tax=Dactylosporangium matsuzakiense TaxID=53360 RepID=A0A9W6KGM4_9ACTN|nr:metallophosphoesterase [Dactylosporangium matsuzakiense]UWZ44957.1 metallophosphoesterase [Dactylosporangium matsuzakiense]GLK99138.1 metallophosphatase [Dactylosporangium matsuzakiense]
MIAILLAVVLLVVGGIHFYLWKRLVKDTTSARRARAVGSVAAVVLALVIPATLALSRALPHSQQALVAWPGYLWLALMFYLLVTLALLEIPRLAIRLWQRRRAVAAPVDPDSSEKPDFDPSRRLVLGRSLAATAGVLSASAVGIGVYQAMGAPNLKRVPIRLAKLPASMNGFRIAVVSDIHLGPLLGRAHTERIVRMINGVDADLVAIVGDLVDGSVAELGPAAEPLQDLRGKHGAFFVTGNHEYFSGFQEWVDEVNSLGVRVLRNERVDVLGLDLAGVNDLSGESIGDGPDFAKALDGRDANRPVVLLAHQPIQAHDAARHGVDLQLSGHTHGGQMVPFNLLVGLQQPIVAGLGTVDGTQVYVTRGAGFWGPPVRFGAPPDISIVELHGA